MDYETARKQNAATREAAIARGKALTKKILALVRKAWPSIKDTGCMIEAEGVIVGFQVEPVRENVGSLSFGSRYNGKLRIRFNYAGYKNRSYPEPKDGFDVSEWAKKITERIAELVQQRVLNDRREVVLDKNMKAADALSRKYKTVAALVTAERYDTGISVLFRVTADQADKLLAAAADMGLLKTVFEDQT